MDLRRREIRTIIITTITLATPLEEEFQNHNTITTIIKIPAVEAMVRRSMIPHPKKIMPLPLRTTTTKRMDISTR